MKLNEDIFDDVEKEIPGVEVSDIEASELEPEGPELGEDTGIANLIHDLLIDENEAIQAYNNAAANMESYPELVEIMHNIAGEEYAHIGELQKALELLSPNASNVEEGEVESKLSLEGESEMIEEALDKNSDVSLVDSAIKDLINFLDTWYSSNIAPVLGTTVKKAGWTSEAQESYLDFYNTLTTRHLTESAEIISPRGKKEAIEYRRDFQRVGDYSGNGFSFDCDKDGNPISENPTAKENFDYCLEHSDEYTDMGIVEHKYYYTENALARCSKCGTEFELYDEYLGACECPKCGQWYNVFGQEVTNPETWSHNDDW